MEVDILNITKSNIIYVLLIIDSALTIGQQINPELNFLMFKNNFLS